MSRGIPFLKHFKYIGIFYLQALFGFLFQHYSLQQPIPQSQPSHWDQGHTHIQWQLYTSLAYNRLLY